MALRDVFPELQSMSGAYGCWNPRRVEGSATWSLHAEGRAVDTGVPAHRQEMAWSVVCHLVAQRLVYGTMRVIWSGHVWSTEHPSEWRTLRPTTNQHRDHFHVEQFWRSAVRPYATEYPTFRRELEAHREQLAEPG